MKAGHHELIAFFHEVLMGLHLTRISERPWEAEGYKPQDELAVERACWLKAEGKSYAEIAKALKISESTARRYVCMAEPSLDKEPDRDLDLELA